VEIDNDAKTISSTSHCEVYVWIMGFIGVDVASVSENNVETNDAVEG